MLVGEFIKQLVDEDRDSRVMIDTGNGACHVDGITSNSLDVFIIPDRKILLTFPDSTVKHETINHTVDKLSELTKEDFHGYRSEIWCVLEVVYRAGQSHSA